MAKKPDPDPVADALGQLGAPWYVRLGWKAKKGAIMNGVLKFLDGKLGKNWKRVGFGVVFILLLLERAAEILFGFSIPLLHQALSVVALYLGSVHADAPAAIDEGAKQIPAIIAALTTGVMGLIALLQPMLRWLLSRPKA